MSSNYYFLMQKINKQTKKSRSLLQCNEKTTTHICVCWSIFIIIIIIIILCYIYIPLLHRRGESPCPPPVCSIHLDDATAAILRQNTPHTPVYLVERRQRHLNTMSSLFHLGFIFKVMIVAQHEVSQNAGL